MKNLNFKRLSISLSLFLILFFSNFTQLKDLEGFSFNKLKNEKIVFKDISMGNGYQIYDDRISAIVEANSTESKIYPIKISNSYPIYHGCYDSISNNTKNEEYLQFYDTKINISLLLKNNLNKQIDSMMFILFLQVVLISSNLIDTILFYCQQETDGFLEI